MSDRAATLSALADRLAEKDGVADAWTAKSFTDRLFVVEVPSGDSFPDGVRETLHDNGMREADEVYDIDGAEGADFAGGLADGRRYRFVDVESRGEMQSYVVD